MANVKITDLPSLTGASSASTDVLPVVNIAGDATSKMTRAEFFKNVPAIDLIGAITTGSWNGSAITAPYGGTGITSYTIGDLVYASTTSALSKLADVATGNALISGGVGVAPSYGKIGLTTHISGTLPVANGGTNITSYTIGDILFASTSGVLSPLADVATGNVIISGGVGVAPSYGKVGLTTHVSGTLPVANGGTGAATLTGYVKGSGTSAMTASATIPNTDVSGLGTMSTQAASAVAITGGTINGASVGATTASTGAFTTLSASSTVSGTGFSTYLASPPAIGGTTPAAVTGTSVASTSVLTSGFTTLSAGTLALAFASKGVVQVTPNATGSFTSTVPPAGTRCTLIVLTSGTTSFTMTFGTGFKTAGTLATGTVTAKTFVFQFISDGTTLIEASRTTAL